MEISKLCSLAIVLLVTLCARPVCADGSVTQILSYTANPTKMVLTFLWTGDASNGTVPSTDTSTVITAEISGMNITTIETIPGSGAAAPTNGYDITLINANGIDMAGGKLASRSSTLPEQIICRVNATDEIYITPPVTGVLTLVVTGNSVASATGVVVVNLER